MHVADRPAALARQERRDMRVDQMRGDAVQPGLRIAPPHRDVRQLQPARDDRQVLDPQRREDDRRVQLVGDALIGQLQGDGRGKGGIVAHAARPASSGNRSVSPSGRQVRRMDRRRG
jgi:hypothetical protein